MSLISSIEGILKEQLESYKAMHSLLTREKASLIVFDGPQIEEISKEKDTLVLKLRLLEEERLRLIDKYAEENPSFGSSSGRSLAALAVATGQPEFADIRTKLVSVVQAIQELNKSNKTLIDRSLMYIKGTACFFEAFGYNKNGALSGKGTLVSRET